MNYLLLCIKISWLAFVGFMIIGAVVTLLLFLIGLLVAGIKGIITGIIEGFRS